MLAVTLSLAFAVLVSWQAVLIALAAAALLLTRPVSTPALVAGGAVAGWLLSLI